MAILSKIINPKVAATSFPTSEHEDAIAECKQIHGEVDVRDPRFVRVCFV
jgi:hypothetical protein